MCSRKNSIMNTEANGVDNAAFDRGNEHLEKGSGRFTINELPDTENKRAHWGNGLEFLMSCIALSVGLGNVWRFPFTAYENGGGAFLIPYLIVLMAIGRPLYLIEMALGQFASRGNVRLFQSLSPFMKGVGVGQLIGTVCVATYYCCLMAITILYIFNSFAADLPWAVCQDAWAPHLRRTNRTCVASNARGANHTAGGTISSSELFFTQEILQETTDISDGIGLPEWRLTLCLFLSWVVTFLVSVRGVRSSGKAAYFLALFPYVVMVALLARAATLEGAATGIYYFVRTDWPKLLEPEVWYAAVTQCFFSLSVGFGPIVMFSSYNDLHHNIRRDALVVTTLDTFTSLLAGVTIFAVLGNLAHNLGVTPDQVVNSGGTGLAFISYPDAIAKFEVVPWLFAILFFSMLFVLGIGSLTGLHGTVNAVLQDFWPALPPWAVSLTTAICGFVIGLVYVTPGGQFLLNLVDFFGGTFIIFIFVIVEVTGVMWLYGLENFALDVEFMLRARLGAYWRVSWGLVTPVLLCIIFAYFLTKVKRLTYGPHPYPDGVLAFGWAILVVSVLQFFLWTGCSIHTNRASGFPAMVKKAFSSENWGPRDRASREEWQKFKEDAFSRIEMRGESWSRRMCSTLLGRR